MLSKAAAAQLQLDGITSATACNASPPPRSAPLSKAEQEHGKRLGGVGWGGALDEKIFQFANLRQFYQCVKWDKICMTQPCLKLSKNKFIAINENPPPCVPLCSHSFLLKQLQTKRINKV